MFVLKLLLVSFVIYTNALDCKISNYYCNCAGNVSLLKSDLVQDSCKQIYNWTCKNCGIRQIDPETFAKLPVTNISLEHNAITSLDGWIDKLTRLERLFMQNNSISALRNGTDGVTIPVMYFYLSYNNISIVEADSFKNMRNLLILDVKHNKIETISNGTFRNNNVLKILNLNFNCIHKIEEEAFRNLTKLQFLNLAHNAIEEFSPKIFVYIVQLLDLNLQNNSLSIINNVTFSELRDLMKLDLSWNSITQIDVQAFHQNAHLKYLNLASNDIRNISNGLFRINNKLLQLDLSRNEIQYLPRGIFNNLTNLNHLHLNHNRLTKLDAGIVFNLDYLRNLYVDNNELINFNAPSLLNYTHKLQFISLDNNLWDCNYLENILAHLKNKNINVRLGNEYRLEHINGIRCEEFESVNDDYQNIEINIMDLDKVLKKIDGNSYVSSKRKNNFYMTLFINVTVNK